MPTEQGRAGSSRVGELVELDVGPVAHGGHCVARDHGQVVFVRHALPDERVRARITDGRTDSRFLRADAVQVLRASPFRVTPPCPYAGPGRCGGCDWQHVTPEHTRELKAAVVSEQLRRLAGIERQVTVEPLPGRDDGQRWRSRVARRCMSCRCSRRAPNRSSTQPARPNSRSSLAAGGSTASRYR